MAEQVAKRRAARAPVRRPEAREPFLTLRERMDQLMDDFLGGMDIWPSMPWEIRPFQWRMSAFIPSVDLRDEENRVVLEAELPGMTEKDVDISVSGDSVTIRGEKKEETEEKERGYYCTERSFGSFERTIGLPAEIDRDKVEARFRNGVLRITLPKTKEAVAATKKIPIKAE